MYKKKIKKKIKKKGFTLVELLVSVTLFTVISTIAFTALYSILETNKKTKTLKMVINNLNMVMESMSREIRVGYDYTCGLPNPKNGGLDCSTLTDSFSFKTKDAGVNTYYIHRDNTIKRKITGEPNFVSMISDDIKIESLKFFVKGNTTGDSIQPRVLIIIKGTINRWGINSTFDIQTTISQRRLAP